MTTDRGVTDQGMSRVDALFSGEPERAPQSTTVRLRSIRRLLGLALPLVVLGIPCWTSVPGALLTIGAYLIADGEMARVEAGLCSDEEISALRRYRRLATRMLYACVVTLVIQLWLLSTPLYANLIGYLANVFSSGAERLSAG